MITARLVGASAVVARLGAMPERVRAALKKTILEWSIRLTRDVKEHKLSGQVLHVRSGTLRRKINPFQRETATSITGGAGVKLAYAAAHEYGFDGVVSVRSHLRTVRQVFGRSLGSPVTYSVGAHSRHMRLPERSFLRSSLAENADAIRASLRAAVAGGLGPVG